MSSFSQYAANWRLLFLPLMSTKMFQKYSAKPGTEEKHPTVVDQSWEMNPFSPVQDGADNQQDVQFLLLPY